VSTKLATKASSTAVAIGAASLFIAAGLAVSWSEWLADIILSRRPCRVFSA
jgi:hypothetical protein